jgi:TolB-like protein
MKSTSASVSGSVDFSQRAPDRLDSWKEVASFFQRDVRTVQLWEKGEGLPVRRQHHKKRGSIYAYRHELQVWRDERSTIACSDARLASIFGIAQAAVPGTIPGAKRSRILTLPFEVISSSSECAGDPECAGKFAEGLANDLVFELRRWHWQPVVIPSCPPAARDGSTIGQLRRMARKVGSDVILRGSIRHFGNQVRVSAQTIRTTDLLCLWSGRFDARLDNAIQAQADLASQIGKELRAQRVNGVREVCCDGATKEELALQVSDIGFHYWRRHDRTSLMKAATYFQDAIELNPKCAEAYAGLVNTYVFLSYSHLMPGRQGAASARQAIETALGLNRDSVKVRNAHINFLINFCWDFPGAAQRCRELIDSGHADGHTLQLYSALMTFRGRHHEAIDLSLSAYRLDPESDLVTGTASLAYFCAGDYGNARSFIHRTIDLNPQFVLGYSVLGRAEAGLGRWDEAISAFTRGLAVLPGTASLKALLAYAYAGSGRTPAADALLNEIESESEDECFAAYDVSAVHAILNREQEALWNLQRAYVARDMRTLTLPFDPRFASLRGMRGFDKVASAHTAVRNTYTN